MNFLRLFRESTHRLELILFISGLCQFVTGLSRELPFEEANDTKDFEASKLGGTIKWE